MSRHTCAMTIHQAAKDLRKVSLCLGHSSIQTTEIHTRADPTVILGTLEAAISPKLRTGRFKATDKLIAFLKAPTIMRRMELFRNVNSESVRTESAQKRTPHYSLPRL